MPRSPQETMDELMSTLTRLANPKYVHEPMGPELWISLNSIRMDLSPNTIHESLTVRNEPESHDKEQQAEAHAPRRQS